MVQAYQVKVKTIDTVDFVQLAAFQDLDDCFRLINLLFSKTVIYPIEAITISICEVAD